MMIILALATAAFASEPRHEVSLELGTHNSNNPAWDVIGSATSNTLGLRGGYGLNSQLTVIGSWHIGNIVTDHGSDSYDVYYEDTPSVDGSGSGQSGASGSCQIALANLA